MAFLTYLRAYLPFLCAVLAVSVLYTVEAQTLEGKLYLLGNLTTCSRVPNEPPCNIPRSYFVSDYNSRQYYKLMEKIYRMVRDVARLDSRKQCTSAYEQFLCAQYFPRCRKAQDPRYENLDMSRRIIHDSQIATKCSKVIGACNSAVGARFIGDRYYLCDFLNYPPEGWELNRCVKYDEENRCQPQKNMVSWVSQKHLFEHNIKYPISLHTTEREINVVLQLLFPISFTNSLLVWESILAGKTQKIWVNFREFWLRIWIFVSWDRRAV